MSCSESGKGEEAANAQATSARFRALPECPRQFTLENYRLPLALPQIIQQLGKSHAFAATHSQTDCSTSQQETYGGLCRNCGRRHFLVESRGKLRINVHREGQLSHISITPYFKDFRHRETISPAISSLRKLQEWGQPGWAQDSRQTEENCNLTKRKLQPYDILRGSLLYRFPRYLKIFRVKYI